MRIKPSKTGTTVVVPSPISVTNPIVYPIENNDRTDEFINSTDSTLSFSNNTLTKAALYSFEFIGESIIKSEAVAKSTPINYPIAYPHRETI